MEATVVIVIAVVLPLALIFFLDHRRINRRVAGKRDPYNGNTHYTGPTATGYAGRVPHYDSDGRGGDSGGGGGGGDGGGGGGG